MHYEHTYNTLYVVMDMVGVNPNLAYNYDYTALQVHYNALYVHNALWMDALRKVLPELLTMVGTADDKHA